MSNSSGFSDPRLPPTSSGSPPSLPSPANGMSGQPLRRSVKITNPQGLHMRPITAFVELAGRFQSSVYVYRDENQRINGKSPLSLLGLAAEQGTELTIEVSGPDQEEALEALTALLTKFSQEENEEPAPAPPPPSS